MLYYDDIFSQICNPHVQKWTCKNKKSYSENEHFVIPDILDTSSMHVAKTCLQVVRLASGGDPKKALHAEAMLQSILLVTIEGVIECFVDEGLIDEDQFDSISICAEHFIERNLVALFEIAVRRITHSKKKSRWCKTSMVDLKVTSMLIVLNDVSVSFEDKLSDLLKKTA